MTFCAGAHEGKLPSTTFDGHRPCGSRDIIILVYGRKPIKLGYHLVKFGDHGQSDSDDIAVLLCHVISQDYVIKGSLDFISRSLSR